MNMVQTIKRFDPSEIGRTIRNIRKRKEIGIVELANSVGFSTGKLSNIENGKLEKVNQEDIDKICSVLSISRHDLLESSETENEENPSFNFSIVSHYIGKGLYAEAKDILFGTRLLFHLEKNPKHISHCNFLMGELMYRAKNINKAIYYFQAVIENGSFREQVIRSYNALSTIFFEQGDRNSAIQFSLDALSFAQRIRSKDIRGDLINTHYNLALVYCHLRLTNQSSHYLNSIERISKNNERISILTHHLKAVLYMQKGDHLKATELLLEVIKNNKSNANSIELINTIVSLYLLSKYNPVANEIKNLVEMRMDEFLQLNQSNPGVMNQLLVILHSIIEISLFQKDYSKAICFLHKCVSISERMPDLSESYRTFYFYAMYLKHTDEDRQREAAFLEKALLNDNNDCLTRALIHHRLGEIRLGGKDKSHYYYASSLFHEHIFINGMIEIPIMKFLPKPIF